MLQFAIYSDGYTYDDGKPGIISTMGDNALTGMVANIPVYGSLFIGNNAGITLGEGSSSVNDCIFLGTNAGEGIKSTEYTTISSIVALGNYSGSQSNEIGRAHV